MRVVIKTIDNQIIILNVDKIEIGWVEGLQIAYIGGESYPIELITGVIE